jgi:hypothetical protein
MFGRKKIVGLAVLSAAVIAGTARLSFADQLVTYYTTGAFSNTSASNGANLAANNGASATTETLTLIKGDSTTILTFTNLAPLTVNLVGNPIAVDWSAAFGNFSIGETGLNDIATGTSTFTLSIFQTSPGAATGTLVASQSVLIGITTGTGGSSIDFISTSFSSGTSPNINYFLSPTSYLVDTSSSTPAPSSATVTGFIYTGGAGDPPPVPLPAVAGMGMSMFGLFGSGLLGRKLLRRKA